MVNISWADVGGKMIDAPSQPVCLPIFVGFQDRRFSVRLILHSILFRRDSPRVQKNWTLWMSRARTSNSIQAITTNPIPGEASNRYEGTRHRAENVEPAAPTQRNAPEPRALRQSDSVVEEGGGTE